MNSTQKQAVISTLIGAKRPDLANIAALQPADASTPKLLKQLFVIAGRNKSTRHNNASAIVAAYYNLDKKRAAFAALPLEEMVVVAAEIVKRRMASSRRRVLAKLALKHQPTAASGWQDTAMAELAAEMSLDIDLLEWKRRGNYIEIEGDGREEYMVFQDDDDAEKYAIEYVEEMIDDDPTMFNASFIGQYLYVSPMDIRMISSEEADNYIENLDYDIEREDYDQLMNEAGMERQWDQMVEKSDELEEALEMTEDPKAEKKIQKQLQKLTSAKEKFIDKAKDKAHDAYEREISRRLKDDPVEWAEELGFDMGRDRPSWLQVDSKKAAEEAVGVDGVGHFLSGYDGNQTDLKSGAVAFRTN